MPIYEFACQDCGHEFEKIQSFSDNSTPACPNCQGRHVQRRLSAPAIHFKGSGWYITDSKNAAKKSATGSTGGGEADGKGESSKSESGKADVSKNETSKSETGKSEAPAAAPASAKAAD
jgi:putative FmdB family regulatory protein